MLSEPSGPSARSALEQAASAGGEAQRHDAFRSDMAPTQRCFEQGPCHAARAHIDLRGAIPKRDEFGSLRSALTNTGATGGRSRRASRAPRSTPPPTSSADLHTGMECCVNPPEAGPHAALPPMFHVKRPAGLVLAQVCAGSGATWQGSGKGLEQFGRPTGFPVAAKRSISGRICHINAMKVT
jgi:hypothetical protein